MTRVLLLVASALVLLSGTWGLSGELRKRQQTATSTTVTKEQFEAWMRQLSNWGRWGKDDQLGAANLITDDKRRQAAARSTISILSSPRKRRHS